MADTSKVLEVLREARGMVATDWGSGFGGAGSGGTCASVGIGAASGGASLCEISIAAHRAFLNAAGITAYAGGDALDAVYAFNDAQASVAPVLAAFDKAIATLEAEGHEATPNADDLIDVLNACRTAGEVVARYIVSEHPEMDVEEMSTLAAAELFYAAQDAARVVAHAAKA